ncbi:MAG: phosphatidylglycerophosphatase A [Pseudomonadota bacterium]|nr:phosphatidylglycerophosphatase A [Pseudomonadota bacterium]
MTRGDTGVPARFVFSNPVHFLAFGFGSGLSPVAPGTAGTVVAIPFFLLMVSLNTGVYLLLTAAIFAVGIPICGRTARDIGVHDHGGIVWDEIAGYLITMVAAPPGWLWVIAGFLAFRLFDVVKPWPIGWADQRVSGGFGIMLDDAIAAIYAALLLWLLQVLSGSLASL